MTHGDRVTRSPLSAIEDAPARFARSGGCLHLFIIAAGLLAEGVRHSLLRAGDPLVNLHVIAGSPVLWTSGVVAAFAFLPCALVPATIEYRLLKPVHRPLALLAFAAKVVSIALEAGNQTFLILAGRLASGGERPEPAWREVDLVLRAHDVGFDISLVMFGLVCLPLGYPDLPLGISAAGDRRGDGPRRNRLSRRRRIGAVLSSRRARRAADRARRPVRGRTPVLSLADLPRSRRRRLARLPSPDAALRPTVP